MVFGFRLLGINRRLVHLRTVGWDVSIYDFKNKFLRDALAVWKRSQSEGQQQKQAERSDTHWLEGKDQCPAFMLEADSLALHVAMTPSVGRAGLA